MGQPCGLCFQLRLLGEWPVHFLFRRVQIPLKVFQRQLLPLQILGYPFQGVVDAGDIAHHIIGQLRRVGEVLLHRHPKLCAVKMELHRESPVLAQVKGLFRVRHTLTGFHQSHTRLLALGVGLAQNGHGKSVLLDRVGLQNGEIGGKGLNEQPRLGHLMRKMLDNHILRLIPLGHVIGFQQLQFCHLNVQVHLLFDSGVAGGDHLDLGIGEGGGVHILNGAGGGFAGHHLTDKLLLVFHQPPVVSVKGALGHIAVNLHLLILIAAPDNAACPLFQVGGPPRTIEIVGGNELRLTVRASTHFLRTAQQDSHLALTDLRK